MDPNLLEFIKVLAVAAIVNIPTFILGLYTAKLKTPAEVKKIGADAEHVAMDAIAENTKVTTDATAVLVQSLTSRILLLNQQLTDEQIKGRDREKYWQSKFNRLVAAIRKNLRERQTADEKGIKPENCYTIDQELEQTLAIILENGSSITK